MKKFAEIWEEEKSKYKNRYALEQKNNKNQAEWLIDTEQS
jgi:hypothetical protein